MSYIKYTMEETAELSRRAQLGDQYALNALFYNYINALRARLTSRWGYENYETDDIISEFAPKYMEAIMSYDPNKSERGMCAWVMKWLDNFAMRAYDKSKTKKSKMLSFIPDYNVFRTVERNTPFTIMSRNEYVKLRSEVLSKAMQTLEIEGIYLIKLYYFKRRTLKDIAADIGTTFQTVHNRLQRCLKRLREAIEPYRDDLR
jgi:RNA polymerase sigma factor (sigma-70 family)